MEEKITQLNSIKKWLDDGLINEAEFNLLKINIFADGDLDKEIASLKKLITNNDKDEIKDHKNLNDELKNSSLPTESNKSTKWGIKYFFIVLAIISLGGISYYLLNKNSIQASTPKIMVDNSKIIADTVASNNQNSTQTNAGTNIDETKKNIIEKYLKAQDNRNFNEFSSYYAPSIRRNWEMYNPTLAQIQSVTDHLWLVTSSSSQTINGMETVNDSTIKVDVTNTYTTRKKNITKQIGYYIYFIFDSNNEIVETYGFSKSSFKKSNNDSLSTSYQQEVKRDPEPKKDFANVFWKRQYTLFDLITDEPIFPININGVSTYKIYYSSNEDPNPHYGEFTVPELENLTAYKFKNEESCLKFCNSKKNAN